MKKDILKYLIVASAFILILGCNDDFLERYPLDAISNETFWTTESDLANYNNSFYDKVKDDENYPIMMGAGPGIGFNF
jgi:hypothetical protein